MSIERLHARLLQFGLAAALGGGAAASWGYFNEPRTFYTAWLAAFYFWLSMPLGALALLLVWDLTGGRWEPIARLPLSAMAATFPLFILLFLPVIAGLHDLYPWTRPEVATGLRNRWYLNLEFFSIRAGIDFAIWNGLAAWRLRRPGALAGIAPRGQQWLSGLGAMLLVYTVTFAGIDWIMSSEPDWFSSIYGMNIGSAQLLVSLAFALLLIAWGAGRRAVNDEFADRFAALGFILVAVLIFWAYTAFCQWLIVWEENLHSEIHWFIERWSGGWRSVIFALVGAHFLVPFATLVWTPAKRNPPLVAAMAALLLVADMVYIWWLLLPSFRDIGFSWLHPAVMIGIGGVWLLTLATALRILRTAPTAHEPGEERLQHG